MMRRISAAIGFARRNRSRRASISLPSTLEWTGGEDAAMTHELTGNAYWSSRTNLSSSRTSAIRLLPREPRSSAPCVPRKLRSMQSIISTNNLDGATLDIKLIEKMSFPVADVLATRPVRILDRVFLWYCHSGSLHQVDMPGKSCNGSGSQPRSGKASRHALDSRPRVTPAFLRRKWAAACSNTSHVAFALVEPFHEPNLTIIGRLDAPENRRSPAGNDGSLTATGCSRGSRGNISTLIRKPGRKAKGRALRLNGSG